MGPGPSSTVVYRTPSAQITLLVSLAEIAYGACGHSDMLTRTQIAEGPLLDRGTAIGTIALSAIDLRIRSKMGI